VINAVSETPKGFLSAAGVRVQSTGSPQVLIGASVAVACVLAGVGAVYSPSRVVLALGGLGVVILALRNLVWLLAVFTVLTFPEQLPLGIASGTVAKPLGAILVLSWALHLLRNRSAPFLPRDQPLIAAALAVFFVFSVVSALWAADTALVISNAARLLQMVLLFVIVFTAIRTRTDLLIVTGAYVFAASVTAAYAITSGVTVEGRLTGGIANPNFLAAELAAAIILAGFMLAAARTSALRAALVLSIVFNAIGFTLTQSRGGIIALATALVVAVFLAGRLRPHVIVGVLITGVLGATYYFAIAAPAVRDRLTNISAQGSAGRSDEWTIAYRIFRSHSIGGAGLGNYSALAPNYVTDNLQLLRVQFVLRGFVAHNTYLQILSELGVIGSAVFAAFLLGVIGLGVKSLRGGRFRSDHAASAVARGVVVALVGLLAAYFFASALYAKQLWLLLALAAALATVARPPTKVARE
jgi:putative inorganic carbon (hco3(-)) transporter